MLQRSDRLQQEVGAEDPRSAFQRDRDRILYAAHLRRLSGVTQVTSPTELHSFHNRLTHTLEVAQISRRLAERLLNEEKESGRERLAQFLDPDVCEAAALAHDLGHPPFGHNAEKALNTLARGKDPHFATLLMEADGYEGNAQSLRILTKLAIREPGQEGLNLTAATLRASMKYPRLFDTANEEAKYGVFETEKPILQKLFEGLPQGEPTLEAQVMDWADDVAYSVHDLYDFAITGVIPYDRIARLGGQALKEALGPREPLDGVPQEAYDNVCASLTTLPPIPLTSASRFSSDLVGWFKLWVSSMISRFVVKNVSLTWQGDVPKLTIRAPAMDQVAVLKALTYHYAIGSPALAVRQEGERTVIRGLFRILMENLDKGGDKRLFSDEARRRLEKEGPASRIVCDVISSMTDAQAIALHHKLIGNVPASVLDMTTPSVL